MAVTATLTVTPSAPASGQTVTATYVVQGNSPGPSTPIVVTGEVTVGTVEYTVNATLTGPGTPALPETFTVPVAAGLTFVATANPAVFTALVP